MLKKLAIVFLSLLLVMSFVACGKKNIDENNSSVGETSDVVSSVEQDDADNMTSSEFDEAVKDFEENTKPSIEVIPDESSDAQSSTPDNSSEETPSSSTDSNSSETTSSSKSDGWTPFY